MKKWVFFKNAKSKESSSVGWKARDLVKNSLSLWSRSFEPKEKNRDRESRTRDVTRKTRRGVIRVNAGGTAALFALRVFQARRAFFNTKLRKI